MPQEFLDGPDIISVFQQMGRKRMAQRMRGSWFVHSGGASRLFDSSLDHGFVQMMPALLQRARIQRKAGRRKNVLRSPRPVGVRIFPFQRVRQMNTPKSLPKILLMQSFDLPQMLAEKVLRRCR